MNFCRKLDLLTLGSDKNFEVLFRSYILVPVINLETMKHLKISNFWRDNYSSKNKVYEEFTATEYFRKMAAIFSPGESYFYIMNMHNLELDYISPEVDNFYNIESSSITIENLLKNAHPDHIPVLEKKEGVIKDFYFNHLKEDQRLNYKILYSYDLIDDFGKNRTMLLQATVIALSEEGFPQHILSIHTDISHITNKASKNVSFMDLRGDKSYFNVDTKYGKFRKEYVRGTKFSKEFTRREKQIIKLLSEGLETVEIANILNISPNTVSTHRKNIIRKGEFKNTAHMIGDYFKIIAN